MRLVLARRRAFTPGNAFPRTSSRAGEYTGPSMPSRRHAVSPDDAEIISSRKREFNSLRFPSRKLAICYNGLMAERNKLLDEMFLEMRGRCLSLAADLDRLDRAA